LINNKTNIFVRKVIAEFR